MREIVLDTETTGLDPNSGDRIVEIGCVELINHVHTGQEYHQYINPERDMPEEAFAVHGLSETFLKDKPVFAEIVDAFLTFIGDAPLVIHNAAFDIGFLNSELNTLGIAPIPMSRSIDTTAIARRKFPGSPVNLDALCRRFGIDNTSRTVHGALLDSQLLGDVYLELLGGRQPGLTLAADRSVGRDNASSSATRTARPPRPHAPTAAEREAHENLVSRLTAAVWTKI